MSMSSLISGGQETFKKYFQANDAIEMQIAGERARPDKGRQFIAVFYGVLDLIDFQKAANLILEKNYFYEFLRLEAICQQQRRLLERQKMITALFVQAIRVDKESTAIFISQKY